MKKRVQKEIDELWNDLDTAHAKIEKLQEEVEYLKDRLSPTENTIVRGEPITPYIPYINLPWVYDPGPGCAPPKITYGSPNSTYGYGDVK